MKRTEGHLILKETSLSKLTKNFHWTSINLTDGSRVQGPVIRSERLCKHYAEEKADEYNKVCTEVSQLANTSPQNAYTCLTKGVQEKLSFMYGTTTNLVGMFGEIDSTLTKLFPSLVGQTAISNEDRDLFSLLLKMVGLNIRKPTDHLEDYFWSKNIVEY